MNGSGIYLTDQVGNTQCRIQSSTGGNSRAGRKPRRPRVTHGNRGGNRQPASDMTSMQQGHGPALAYVSQASVTAPGGTEAPASYCTAVTVPSRATKRASRGNSGKSRPSWRGSQSRSVWVHREAVKDSSLNEMDDFQLHTETFFSITNICSNIARQCAAAVLPRLQLNRISCTLPDGNCTYSVRFLKPASDPIVDCMNHAIRLQDCVHPLSPILPCTGFSLCCFSATQSGSSLTNGMDTLRRMGRNTPNSVHT